MVPTNNQSPTGAKSYVSISCQFPQRTDTVVEAWIEAERRLHRTWGPKKLHKVLEIKHSGRA
jgi:hypothetical protein